MLDMDREWNLTAEEYESIKEDFTKIRKDNKLFRKGRFPRFVWYGDMERLECFYRRTYDPRTGQDELRSAVIKWEGDDVTHFYVDLKKLMEKVKHE